MSETSTEQYNFTIVRGFAFSALFWLVIGLIVGLWIAFEMFNPALNLTPWLSFGRLRVVHTNGLGLGFGLAAIFSVSYYILQRLTRIPILFPRLAQVHLYQDRQGDSRSWSYRGGGQDPRRGFGRERQPDIIKTSRRA